jgi:hypothetical protein
MVAGCGSHDDERLVSATEAIPEPGSAFPAALEELSLQCDYWPEPREVMPSDFQAIYASDFKSAAEQPLATYRHPFVDQARQPQQLVRFVWLPSFDNAVFIRFVHSQSGDWAMIAKRMSGDGYSIGEVSETLERDLTPTETETLGRLLHQSGLLREGPVDCDLGFDGATWLVERLDRHGYDYVNRWSPSEGHMHAFGLFALELTGWDLGEIY